MYVYIKGILKTKEMSKAIVENSGIGYEINIGALTYNDLPDPPEEVMLYIYHHLREDTEELYGFSCEGEKKLFELILSVSKIGPGKALNVISQVTPGEFASAIKNEDINKLASVKGIGKKTAERMIVDLKDKLAELGPLDYKFADTKINREKMEEALMALLSLGYREAQARDMLGAVSSRIKESDTVENIISKIFKYHG